METTRGQHRHQTRWTITYEQDPADNNVYYEKHTCEVCGIVFIYNREGSIPTE